MSRLDDLAASLTAAGFQTWASEQYGINSLNIEQQKWAFSINEHGHVFFAGPMDAQWTQVWAIVRAWQEGSDAPELVPDPAWGTEIRIYTDGLTGKDILHLYGILEGQKKRLRVRAAELEAALAEGDDASS